MHRAVRVAFCKLGIAACARDGVLCQQPWPMTAMGEKLSLASKTRTEGSEHASIGHFWPANTEGLSKGPA
jgi:hypothetical protein